ncbi:hypothetical protein [Allonocardiopsis opalescens]|uniref:PH (Pleckstrin Homology) domain-containing protein n=1 Tax=Allonocardiopsis opalescens TaxID=1144618 RepID=A0A2T0PZT4_9ACTN|nr:hypothetical protein [Allonocardiopsis opalescens]PRX97059.1 hypothetical protein CLV72_10695 [Allonocardiopsis opalescens]
MAHRWIDLGRRRLVDWSVALFASAGYLAVMLIMFTRGVFDGGPAVALGPSVLTLLCAVAVARLVQVLPRLTTRQGISVHQEGVSLVQERALWFAGRAAHLPWDEIARIREAAPVTFESLSTKGGLTDLVVDVYLRTPGWTGRTPTWARVRAHREAAVPPDAPAAPLTRIRIAPGRTRQPALLQALRAARPELVREG